MKREFSARQEQIVNMMKEGLSQKEVGNRIGISSNTVNAHMSAAMRKLKANSQFSFGHKLGYEEGYVTAETAIISSAMLATGVQAAQCSR